MRELYGAVLRHGASWFILDPFYTHAAQHAAEDGRTFGVPSADALESSLYSKITSDKSPRFFDSEAPDRPIPAH